MAKVELAKADHKEIEKLLLSAYETQQISNVVQREFGTLHDNINWNTPGAQVVFDLVQRSNAYGVLDRVLVTLVAERPYRPDLLELQLALSTRLGWGVSHGPHGIETSEAVKGLEQLLGEGNPFVAAKDLAKLLATAPHQVCHVETPATGSGGTGFLIGPDLVLTNYHVVEDHLMDTGKAHVRFGYFSTAVAGEWIELDKTWDIPSSPYGNADTKPPFGEPNPKELDYAVLRLASRPGDDVLESGVRGWVDLSSEPVLPNTGEPAFIIGHPGNDTPPPHQHPLSVSFAARAFEALNDNLTRAVYHVDTKPGSSGSPVFDGRMRPVVLHHNRGDFYDETEKKGSKDWSRNNRGIPLRTVWRNFPQRVHDQLPVVGENFDSR